jgi:hypothetical protein
VRRVITERALDPGRWKGRGKVRPRQNAGVYLQSRICGEGDIVFSIIRPSRPSQQVRYDGAPAEVVADLGNVVRLRITRLMMPSHGCVITPRVDHLAAVDGDGPH